jgi:hypothetical protein
LKKIPFNVLSTEAYIIYLRKSRADNPEESVEEVLSKHETMLQELAERELGGRIPERCIFREVVSGETIAERPEVNKVLELIENPAVKMVLVVEPARLSRGDLEDCGKIVNAFRYSNTKVMTLQMTYDLQNKMHRKFFEQELMRGNDFLEYSKEILLRGRILSVQKGNYIGNIAPFGYDKTIIDDGPSLKPNDDADAVRLVFDMYVNQGKSYLEIARHLDSIGVKPTRGVIWEKTSIRKMLTNVHYVGKVKFGEHRTEKVYQDGKLVKQRNMPADPDEVIIADGKHLPLVTQEIFDKAQEILNNNPRAKWDAPLKNVLAGLMFCSKCGKAIAQHPYKTAKDRYNCANRNGCGSKSAPVDEVIEAVIFALENEELPKLEVKLKNDDGNSYMIQQKQIKKMKEDLEELMSQEEKQYIFLEKGTYTEEVFLRRNKALHAEMEELKTRIFEASKVLPKEVDYGEKIVTLKKAIASLRDDTATAEAKNKLLKTIIKRIDYEYLSWEGKGKVRYKLHIQLLV